MHYYIIKSAIGASRSDLIRWEKTLEDAIAYAESQIQLWHEAGANPPRYSVHHDSLGQSLWSNF